jgi:hypothetical protein
MAGSKRPKATLCNPGISHAEVGFGRLSIGGLSSGVPVKDPFAAIAFTPFVLIVILSALNARKQPHSMSR